MRRIVRLAIVALVLLLAGFILREEYQTQARARAAERAQPVDVPAGHYILTGNQSTSSLSVIEAGTGRVAGTILLPEGPHELAVSPDGRWAVATLAGDAGTFRPPWRSLRTIAVVDLAAMKLHRIVDLAPHASPHGAVFVDERTVAVTADRSQAVVFVDVEAGTIVGAVDTSVGYPDSHPHILAVSPDRRTIYSANIDSFTVSEIDAADRDVRRHIPFQGSPVAVTASSSNTIWAIEAGANEVYTVVVVDLASGVVLARHADASLPRRIAIVPDHSRVIVTDPGRDEVHVYDAVTRALQWRIALGSGANPSGIAFAPGTSAAFVAMGAGHVVEIDYRAGRVVRTIDVPGQHPDGIAYIARAVTQARAAR